MRHFETFFTHYAKPNNSLYWFMISLSNNYSEKWGDLFFKNFILCTYFGSTTN